MPLVDAMSSKLTYVQILGLKRGAIFRWTHAGALVRDFPTNGIELPAANRLAWSS